MINLTEDLAERSLEHINLEGFKYLCEANKCPKCKFKIGGYLKPTKINDLKVSVVNFDTLIHLHDTHGIPPYVTLEVIKRKLYRTKVAQNMFEEKYKEIYDK